MRCLGSRLAPSMVKARSHWGMILTVPTTPTLVPEASVASTVKSSCTPLMRPTVVRNLKASPSKATTQDRASATPSINKASTPAVSVEKASFTKVNST